MGNREENAAPEPLLILASASPRRRELLALLGLPFTVVSADVDERPQPGETPAEMVVRLSLSKAREVARRYPQGWVIASDTVVVFEGEIMGKPLDPAEATAMLRRMRGQPHVVYTGLALCNAASGHCEHDVAATRVWMRDYTEEEIARYVESGDPLDKAGAYGIQNRAFHPVERVEGCYASVMGLPLCKLARLLAREGLLLGPLPMAACRHYTGHPCEEEGDALTPPPHITAKGSR